MEVLQKELIQVQTLMDNMTREREEESACLKSQYEQLQADHTTSEVRLQGNGPSWFSFMLLVQYVLLVSSLSLSARQAQRFRAASQLVTSSSSCTRETGKHASNNV